MKRVILLLSIAFFLALGSEAQESTVLDGVYVKENTPSRKVIPYIHLREADVMWSKRIWRRIDLRKKMNQVLYFPVGFEAKQGRKNLFAIIKEALLEEGTLTGYDPGSPAAPDDMFRKPLTTDEIRDILLRKKEVNEYDEDGEIVGSKTIEEEVNSQEIKFYEMKEDWFFERERSVMDVRIIGLKPVREYENEAGEPALEDLFWIYFPEARYVFANNEVYNRKNDAERRTYEDVFWKRQFESTIIKESNVYDRQINEYKTGIDALLEAERIKDEIFRFEHDMWSF
ncbi:MAG TPA: gliding motility protein GldN [Flavobacteriales bacterium]|jgi:gliding motility associated protien GldN|nr:gliding motility protein GldN [Salibacteraceae bacterium]HAS36599.1 gliding motility protein GldN [Flavobacteriales bacterium]